MADELEQLRNEVAALRAANEQLRAEARSVASANVNAAQQIMEMSLARQRDLEAHNERIQAALAFAEQASAEKSMFLANISHELRTPLNGIIGMATIVLDEEEDAERRERLRLLLSSGQMLLQIVNDVLDFSKIEVDRLELVDTVFDVWQTAESLVGLLSAGNRRHEVDIRLEIDPRVPRAVRGDELRLRQVLTNLASNAAKFTETGEVVVRLATAGQRIRFEITDTGCGIAPEVLARLFEPFTQGDASATRRKGGTGLGLAISRRLVRLMGGDIRVDTAPGRGSTFWFDVELELVDDARDAAPIAKAPFRGAIVVTGDERLQRTVAQHLGALGVPTVDAADRAGGDANGADPLLWFIDTESPAAVAASPSASDRCILLLGSEGHDAGQWRARFPRARMLYRPLLPTALAKQCLDGTVPGTTTSAATTAGAQPRPGMRVLVVEDNPINTRVAVAYLTKLGCKVDEACNGVEAVAAVAQQRYDVVFMDCQMPVMDGYEATVRIRESEQGGNRRSYIVALTAHALAQDRERCLAAGMDDYLCKPVSRTALAKLLGSRADT